MSTMEPEFCPPANPRSKAAWDAFVTQIGFVDFPKLNAENLDFRGPSFRGMPFYGVFASADLQEVDFTNAEPGWSFFGGAKAERANFSGAYLKKANFGGACLVDARFDNAKAPKSEWSYTNASRASFAGAQLYECFFFDTDFRFAKFTETNLHMVSFSNCYLYGARFDGATGTISTARAVDVGGAEPELISTARAVDVGGAEPELISGDRLLEWLHAQGGTELKAREPRS
jgi:uncharacterized protein YjbI with pentapeptide repeats